MSQPAPSAPAVEPIPEHRLFRLPLFLRLSDAELVHSIDLAAEAGFHGVTIPMTIGGLPIWPSRVPRRHDLRSGLPAWKRRDALGVVVREAQAREMQVYGGMNLWRHEGDQPDDRVRAWFARRRSWVSAPPKVRGEKADASMSFCPTNLDLRRYWGDLLAEAFEAYPLAGLTFFVLETPLLDRPSRARCQCAGCRRWMRERSEMPLDELKRKENEKEIRDLWTRAQRDLLHDWIGYLCQRCHKSRRGLLIQCRTQALLEPRGQSRDESSASLEPARLCRPMLEQGMIDSLILDNMPDEPEALEETLQLNLATWPDDALLYPVLRALDEESFVALLDRLRQAPLTGFVAEWQEALTARQAHRLSETAFANPVVVAERTPLGSAGALMRQVGELMSEETGIAEYLEEMMRFARAPSAATPAEAIESMIENLRGLEARILSGQLEIGDQADKALRLLSQAKRLSRLASLRAQM